MKTTLLYLFLLISATSCDEVDPNIQELQDQMTAIEAQIQDLTSLTCSADSKCNVLPIGTKACGGPTHFIVFSSSTNEIALQLLIDEYNDVNKKYNESSGLYSDCSLVTPPTLSCVDGQCLGVN